MCSSSVVWSALRLRNDMYFTGCSSERNGIPYRASYADLHEAVGDFAEGYSAAMMDPSTTPWDQSQKGSLREKEDYFAAVEGGSKTCH
jgi:hypothetical protein